jgi:glycosyltransferase involved in cell wall biosynthesis
MNEAAKVKVSVGILVYNHEKYIAKAIEGVLAQKVNFDYEIVIGEDCSTDRSAEVIDQYVTKYPDKIRRLSPERNQGLWMNSMKVQDAWRGEYIALMDGDDWWVYENKLQTQIDFLDQNHEYTGCFHDAEIVVPEHEDSTTSKYFQTFRYYSQIYHYRADLLPWDLVERTIIPTSSFVFRNLDIRKELNSYGDTYESLDWLMQLIVIKHSKFRYFNEPWSVYNNNSGGMTKKVATSNFINNNVKVLRRLLNDECYRNFKHHIYHMMAKEATNMFFLDDPSITKRERRKMIVSYIVNMQKHLYYRVLSLLKEL